MSRDSPSVIAAAPARPNAGSGAPVFASIEKRRWRPAISRRACPFWPRQ
jgi:hypothetical protein